MGRRFVKYPGGRQATGLRVLRVLRVRGWGLEVRGWGLEVRGWGLEVRGWGLEVRG